MRDFNRRHDKSTCRSPRSPRLLPYQAFAFSDSVSGYGYRYDFGCRNNDTASNATSIAPDPRLLSQLASRHPSNIRAQFARHPLSITSTKVVSSHIWCHACVSHHSDRASTITTPTGHEPRIRKTTLTFKINPVWRILERRRLQAGNMTDTPWLVRLLRDKIDALTLSPFGLVSVSLKT